MHVPLRQCAICLVFALLPVGCNWFSGEPTSNSATADAGDSNLTASSDDGSGADRPSRQMVTDPYYIIGQPMSEWDVAQWANHESLMIDEPPTLEKLRGRVVVVRFWTDASDACARTMPAMQQLAEEFRGDRVVFVGIYFTSGTLVDDVWADAQLRARGWGVTFPIAEDRRTHNLWWLTRYDNLPATPTFVIGANGRVLHLHPGPDFFPTDDPSEQICDEDYQKLRAAIARALDRQLAESRPVRED